MARDKRAFAQFDVGYLDNPKMTDVLDASSTAVLMHAASILYCTQHSTDGEVALRTMQRKVGGTETDADLLVEAGLWHTTGHTCEDCPEVPAGKAYVHDYLRHNRSSAEVKGKADKASRAAKARWDKEREAMLNAMPDALPPADKTQCPETDSAMQREREREKELKDLSTAKAEDEFDTWYTEYPKKVAKVGAKKAFIKARKKVSAEELMSGLKRYKVSIQGKEKQHIANPATWLNDERWEDDLQSSTPTDGPSVPNQYRMFNP